MECESGSQNLFSWRADLSCSCFVPSGDPSSDAAVTIITAQSEIRYFGTSNVYAICVYMDICVYAYILHMHIHLWLHISLWSLVLGNVVILQMALESCGWTNRIWISVMMLQPYVGWQYQGIWNYCCLFIWCYWHHSRWYWSPCATLCVYISEGLSIAEGRISWGKLQL